MQKDFDGWNKMKKIDAKPPNGATDRAFLKNRNPAQGGVSQGPKALYKVSIANP